MTKRFENIIFTKLMTEALFPSWNDDSNILFRFEDRNFLLELFPDNNKFMKLKSIEFFISGSAEYINVSHIIAIKVAARYPLVKFSCNGHHFTAIYEFFLHQEEHFIDELYEGISAIGLAINEFFFRLGIFEENSVKNNSNLLNLNLN